jgi:hypothetical protein
MGRMNAQKKLARPRQVTTAGVMRVAGSALLVLSLFDALQRLRSVEMRAAVDKFLAEPPGDGLGVSTGWVLDALHVLVLFNGALAAAAAVLAVYVFQRNHAARVGFSIAAGLLLLTSPFSGGAMAMILAFAAVMLWSRPARDWFAGREPAPVQPAGGEPRPQLPDPWALPGSANNQEEPRPVAPQDTVDSAPAPHDVIPSPERPAPAAYPFGSRPDPGWAPPAFDQRPLTPSWAAGTVQDPDRRPAGVVVAAALTWLFAGITALMFLLVVAMLMFGQDALVEALRSDARFDELNVSVDDLLAVVWVVSAVAIFWSVCAVILAVLAFRRVGWARIGLVVSAAMTMLFSLGALPASLLLVVPAAATVVLLFTGGANAWYSRRPRSFGPPPGPPAGGYPGQPTQQQQAQHAPPQVQQQPQAPQPPAQPPQRPSGKPPVW